MFMLVIKPAKAPRMGMQTCTRKALAAKAFLRGTASLHPVSAWGAKRGGDRTWQGNECELGTRGFCGGGTVARRCSSGRCQSSGPPGP